MLSKNLLYLTLIGIIASCTSDPVSTNSQNLNNHPFATNKSTSVERTIVKSSDSRILQQASSINKFAVNMYSQLTQNEENTFFSPYSITSALGMTDLGAIGTTDQQIRDALKVTLQGENFHAAINGLDQSLTFHSNNTENIELNIVNSIWSQNGLLFGLHFLDQLSQHYGAGVNILDFKNKPEPSRITINDWVSQQTNQRIIDLLPRGSITSATCLVLTNAIYFMADWLYKFDPAKSANLDFTLSNGSKIKVPMMSMGDTTGDKRIKLLCKKDSIARVLELPYQGKRIVMDIIVPEVSLNHLESNLSPELFNDLCEFSDSASLRYIRIPKFQFATPSISLKDEFINLGMQIPFSTSADFSNICSYNMYIADVIHKAFIKVDETGTEAAAATAVVMERTSINDQPTFFAADRPFIYLIRDTQTKAILFMGRVLDPTVTQ